MQITQNEIEFKRKVGKSGTRDIFHVKTRGGLHVMARSDGTVLGAGPHRAVARHLAQKFEPDAEWTELSKSDHVDFEVIEHLVPRYEKITEEMRQLQKNAGQE
jgi:hypothetical protein